MRDYIAAKLRYSRERPAGSQVFAREVAGRPQPERVTRAQQLFEDGRDHASRAADLG